MVDEQQIVEDEYKLHAVLRQYAVHENELLNQRVNWCLLVSSFLFAGLALVVGQLDALACETRLALPGWSLFNSAVFGIAITGILVTLASYVGVHAAAEALSALDHRWTKAKARLGEAAKRLPAIRGGGNTLARNWGMAYPHMLLIILTVVWAVVLMVGLADSTHAMTGCPTP